MALCGNSLSTRLFMLSMPGAFLVLHSFTYLWIARCDVMFINGFGLMCVCAKKSMDSFTMSLNLD